MRIRYKVLLYDGVRGGRHVWEAELVVDGGSVVIERKMRLVSEQLIAQLSADRLLKMTPAVH